MILYTYCKHCKSEIPFRTSATDRFVLAKKKGEEVHLTCKKCGHEGEYHVNGIKAKRDKKVDMLTLLILIGGTVGMFIFIWPYLDRSANIYAIAQLVGTLTIPFAIHQGIDKSKSQNVKYFNLKRYV